VSNVRGLLNLRSAQSCVRG